MSLQVHASDPDAEDETEISTQSGIDRELRRLEEALDETDQKTRIDDGQSSADVPPSPAPTPTPPPPPPYPPTTQTPISPMPHPTPPPKKNSLKGFFIYMAIVLLLLTIIGLSLALIFGGFEFGGIYPAKDQVAVIYVQGIMITGGMPDGFGFATSENICKNIRLAAKDDNVKAIVLRVNSPGGSPAAAQEIASEIKKTKSSGKPVVISMGDIAASAAYYISAPADRIVANPDTITGSIGVTWVFENRSAYYDEEGIEHWVAKSGEFKDMGADWRNLTDEEKEYAEEVVMDVFSRFVDEVSEGRNMTREEVLNLSDGRVYTGTSAVELGLVDETGNLYGAIDIAAELGNITGEPAITYMNKPSLSQLLFGGTEYLTRYTDLDAPDSVRSVQQYLCRLYMLDWAFEPAGNRM